MLCTCSLLLPFAFIDLHSSAQLQAPWRQKQLMLLHFPCVRPLLYAFIFSISAHPLFPSCTAFSSHFVSFCCQLQSCSFLFQLYCTFANLIRYICTGLRLAGSDAFGGCKLGMWATKGFILTKSVVSAANWLVCASYTRMTIFFLMWSLRDMSVGQVLFDLPTVKRNQVLFENVVN